MSRVATWKLIFSVSMERAYLKWYSNPFDFQLGELDLAFIELFLNEKRILNFEIDKIVSFNSFRLLVLVSIYSSSLSNFFQICYSILFLQVLHNHFTETGCRGLVIIRNPFKALISHRHLDIGGHTGYAPRSHFEGSGEQPPSCDMSRPMISILRLFFTNLI